jgi:hypothetical protein
MSTIDNSFGVPASILAEWSRELSRIQLPTKGTTFAHVQCRNAALWMARFVLTELHGINSITSLRQGVPPRVITYVLPSAVSVEVAERFILPRIMGNDDTGIRIVTYSGVTQALTSSPFPEYLRSAIIVFDTDFGRVSTQLVAASTELLRVWAQLAARKEAFNGTVVAISPSPDRLWRSDYIDRVFGGPVVDLVLGHDPEPPVFKSFRGNGHNFADDIVGAISSVPLDADTRTTIICHIPLDLGLDVEKKLATTNPFPCPCNTAVVPCTKWITWQPQPENYRGVRVLILEPSPRFLPPIDWACHHILPEFRPVLVVDRELAQVVEVESGAYKDEALHAVTLGEPRHREARHVTLVRYSMPWGSTPLVVHPHSSMSWPVWREGMPEILMRLVAQLNDAHRTLSALPVNFPTESPWAVEVLRRLQMMQLIKPHSPLSPVDRALKERLVLAGHEAGLATSFLKTGFARSLPEALLLAGISRAPSPVVKTLLASVAAACNVGITRVLAAARAPACTVGPGMDAHPLTQLLDKGSLWLAVFALGWEIKDGKGKGRSDIEMGLLFAAFRKRFFEVVERVAPNLNTEQIPDDMTSKDVLATEMAIVRAWIQNLAAITDGYGPVSRAREALTGEDVCVREYGWGNGLQSTPDRRFGVHFGLSRSGDGYTTDTFTLVSNEAVVRVLEDLFPTPPGSEMPDYMALLRTSYRA